VTVSETDASSGGSVVGAVVEKLRRACKVYWLEHQACREQRVSWSRWTRENSWYYRETPGTF